jgi:hypothetical protein
VLRQLLLFGSICLDVCYTPCLEMYMGAAFHLKLTCCCPQSNSMTMCCVFCVFLHSLLTQVVVLVLLVVVLWV